MEEQLDKLAQYYAEIDAKRVRDIRLAKITMVFAVATVILFAVAIFVPAGS
jgi:hypothetical protein